MMVLVVRDKDKKIIWKIYHEKLLKTKFAWDRYNFSQADAVSSAPRLKDKDMICDV